jgi:hypothetical protein
LPTEPSEPPLADSETTDRALTDGGQQVLWFDLQVGDCIDEEVPLPLDVYSLLVVPCEDPHNYELYEVFDLAVDQAEYPGDREVEREAFTSCIDAFEDYVGVPYHESPHEITFFYPSPLTWAGGDREVMCILEIYDGPPVADTLPDLT